MTVHLTRSAWLVVALVALAVSSSMACSGAETAATASGRTPTGSTVAPSAADLSMRLSEDSRVVPARTGGTLSYDLAVVSTSGSAEPVTLSMTSEPPLPTGVLATFEPARVTPVATGTPVKVTARVLAGSTPGQYALTFTASGPGGARTSTRATLEIAASENPVVTENLQRGTRDWQIPRPGFTVADDVGEQIKGYASSTSVATGGEISFHVSVNPPQPYDIEVFRVGWYAGTGGRLMSAATGLAGTTQRPCPVQQGGLTECAWTPSFTLNVPSHWTSGAYLAVLSSASGFQNYVLFFVRDDRPAALLFQASVNTYQAYNDYPSGAGGRSYYTVPQSVRVSFDRPYANGGGSLFFPLDLPAVRWLEREGYDVTYTTDVDTHQRGSSLLSRRGFVSGGHSEYWSKEMYDAAEQARDAGVSLAFLGANSIYWQVRYEPSSSGGRDRILVCYKSSAADPVPGPLSTTLWRDPVNNRPEQRLIGIQYSSQQRFTEARAPYVVTAGSHWAFAGTGLAGGATIPNAVGYEIDRFNAEYPVPPAREHVLLSNSPMVNRDGAIDVAQSSIYRSLAGGWVFASGTTEWTALLDPVTGDPRIQRITGNVLDAFVADAPTPRGS